MLANYPIFQIRSTCGSLLTIGPLDNVVQDCACGVAHACGDGAVCRDGKKRVLISKDWGQVVA